MVRYAGNMGNTEVATRPRGRPPGNKKSWVGAALERNNSAYESLRNDIEQDAIPQYPPRLQEALNLLTLKQRRFAQLVAAGRSNVDAYVRSYDCNPERDSSSLAVDACKIISDANVANAVNQLRLWLDARWLRDESRAIDFCMQTWHTLAETSKDEKVRIKATELIAKRHAAFVQRVEVTHYDGGQVDSAAAALTSILGDIGMGEALDVPYQRLETPSIGVSVCPHCGKDVHVEADSASPPTVET